MFKKIYLKSRFQRILCKRHEINRITTDGDRDLQTEGTF